MKPNENHIAIKLEGFTCSPEVISEKIGLKPTKTALKDQAYQVGSKRNKITRKYSNNYWEFREIKIESTWISELLNQFISEHILPRKEIIRQVASKCDGELSIVQFVNESCNPGLHFKKEEIELLSYIGLELDLDLYCLAED